MKKGWQIRKVIEHAWDYKFTRWYVIAPSGNKYAFYRTPFYTNLYIIKDYKYSSDIKDYAIKEFVSLSSNYYDMLNYIYNIESLGGFPKQKRINKILSASKEMNYLFSKPQHTTKYDSI